MFSLAFAKFALPLAFLAAVFGINHGKQGNSDQATSTPTQAEQITQITTRDTSDVSLNADVKLIDAQLQLLDSSTGSLNASFTDDNKGNRELEQNDQ